MKLMDFLVFLEASLEKRAPPERNVQRRFCKYRNWSLLVFFCTKWRSLDYFTLRVSPLLLLLFIFLDYFKVKQKYERLLRWCERADVDGGAGRSAVGP